MPERPEHQVIKRSTITSKLPFGPRPSSDEKIVYEGDKPPTNADMHAVIADSDDLNDYRIFTDSKPTELIVKSKRKGRLSSFMAKAGLGRLVPRKTRKYNPDTFVTQEDED